MAKPVERMAYDSLTCTKPGTFVISAAVQKYFLKKVKFLLMIFSYFVEKYSLKILQKRKYPELLIKIVGIMDAFFQNELKFVICFLVI